MNKTKIPHLKLSDLDEMMPEEPSSPDILGMGESLLNLNSQKQFLNYAI